MKLEKLGMNFSLLNQEEQKAFFLLYSERRAIDLAEPVVIKGQKSSSTRKKGKNIAVTNEALEILKKLGLVL